jgi:hypothetical protein
VLQTYEYHCTSLYLKFKSILLVKRIFILLNAAFVLAMLDKISRVRKNLNLIPKVPLLDMVPRQRGRGVHYKNTEVTSTRCLVLNYLLSFVVGN